VRVKRKVTPHPALSRHAFGRSLRRQRGEGKRIINIDTLAL